MKGENLFASAMKSRLSLALLLIAFAATIGVLLMNTAGNIVCNRVDVADAITMENGVQTYHYTVTAKPISKK